MVDSTLIPPVGYGNPVPKPRSVPLDKDQSRRKQKQPEPKKPQHDDDAPSIDEYA